MELYELAKPLLKPVQFSNELDFTWYEIWHHEGRRARHGASMMGPDYTHWHGTYEVAKHFYSRDGARTGAPDRARARSPATPKKAAAAEALQKKLDEVLNSAQPPLVPGQDGPRRTEGTRAAPGGVQEAVQQVERAATVYRLNPPPLAGAASSGGNVPAWLPVTGQEKRQLPRAVSNPPESACSAQFPLTAPCTMAKIRHNGLKVQLP